MDKKLKTSLELELEVKELRSRVEKLEALLAESLVRPKEASAPVVEKKPEIAPEIILAISAAVAAFLGARAKIHQIHLPGSTAWAAQGRATVQASHGMVRGLR